MVVREMAPVAVFDGHGGQLGHRRRGRVGRSSEEQIESAWLTIEVLITERAWMGSRAEL